MNVPSEMGLIADVLVKAVEAGGTSVDDSIPDVLRAIRKYLGMDVAFVAEFTDDQRKFCFVDSATEDCPVQIGNADPLEESYCQRVVDGRLPELIHDALLNPIAQKLPVTQALPVRSHLSVPIYLSDGTLYGTFCCFNTSKADYSLDERHVAMMRVFAEFSANRIERHINAERTRKEKVRRIKATLEDEAYSIHYQPIFQLKENRVIGFESLSRFSAEPLRTPDIWFREAEEVGLDSQLETATIEKALIALSCLPEDTYIALNSSPANIINGNVRKVLEGFPLERIVLEVTEHSIVSDYSALASALAPLRQQGLRFAVDDAGAGYASFRHILKLKPDIIKLDIELIRDIDTDTDRRALAAAIIGFAKQTGSTVIAEGVETEFELKTLRELRVTKAQGYLLGRPTELSACVDFCKHDNTPIDNKVKKRRSGRHG